METAEVVVGGARAFRWHHAGADDQLQSVIDDERSSLELVLKRYDAVLEATVVVEDGKMASAGQPLRQSPQADAPTLGRADGVAHLLPALAVAVDVAVLELHPGAVGALGDEADL